MPSGTTGYNYREGLIGDGDYHVTNTTNNWGTYDWFQIGDHTPGDSNGRMLVVNASFASGEFFRIPITGLCENTTYEFSSWMVNLTPLNSPLVATLGNPQPNKVRFEILDAFGLPLPSPISGSTGDILPSLNPTWTQYGLVFQTPIGQTSVILRMINEGAGGYGNDLAIDDIVFKSCGDAITVSDGTNNSVSICSSQTPYATTVNANPDGSVFGPILFYQWQVSADGTTWTDILGEVNQSYNVTGLTATTYYRAKVAESPTNLNNAQCNTLSDVFQIDVTQAPVKPPLECWETATFNNATCVWNVTGTQSSQPTIECWEIADFNNTTCTWDITGTQPTQPTIECWEITTFNNATCVWDVSGTQPTQPNQECWETVNFNNTTCMWEITGSQPSIPTTGLQCWETATFNNATCSWDITGIKPGAEYNEDVIICSSNTQILEAITSIPNPVYQWDTGKISQSISVNSSGTYSVEISSSTTCDFETRNFMVTQVESPIIDSVVSDGNTIIVNTSNTGDFEYSLDGIMFQSSQTFINVQGGLYTVSVKQENCPDVTTIQHLHFYIPKFFTPNGDNVNDTFDLKGIEFYSFSQVSIFDRYGKLLKNAVNTSLSWNGTFNGQLLPTGDYWYVIVIEDQKFTGHITLKR